MRIAVSHDGSKIDNGITVATPHDFQEAMETIANITKNLTHQEKIGKAGGGVRALNKTKDKLLDHPHIPLWVNEPLKQELEKIVGSKVYLENDAAMAALGEAINGAGKDFKIVAYLTVSTGVGGARIVNKRIDESWQGFEPGNMIVNLNGGYRSISGIGYLESYISGSALEEMYGQKPFEIQDPEVWEESARILAYGLNNIAVLWSPEAIILGGSVMDQIPFERVQDHFTKALKIFPEVPKLIKAQLQDLAGLHGALEYLKQIS